MTGRARVVLPKKYLLEKSSQQGQHSLNRRTENALLSAYFTFTYAKSSNSVFLYPTTALPVHVCCWGRFSTVGLSWWNIRAAAWGTQRSSVPLLTSWGKSEQLVGTSKGRWDTGGRGNGGIENEMGKIDWWVLKTWKPLR